MASDIKRQRLDDDNTNSALVRCGQPLWVLVDTLECAAVKRCVSCCHKILSGQASSSLLPNTKPNVRPELCPRSSGGGGGEQQYVGPIPTTQGVSILTVGDGDLSFSLALAKCMMTTTRSSTSNRIVATTYEPRENLARSYPQTGLANIAKLTKLGCQVLHGVDAEKLDEAGLVEDDEEEEKGRFDLVIFNFPCVAVDDSPGLDGQLGELALNQQLLERFGRSVGALLKPDCGEVHVTHKTKAAFQHWNVPDCVQRGSSEEVALRARGALVFDRCCFPGYINRKVRDAKSFPMTDAVTFMFDNRPQAAAAEDAKVWAVGAKETLVEYCKRVRKAGVVKVPVDDALLRLVNRVIAA